MCVRVGVENCVKSKVNRSGRERGGWGRMGFATFVKALYPAISFIESVVWLLNSCMIIWDVFYDVKHKLTCSTCVLPAKNICYLSLIN